MNRITDVTRQDLIDVIKYGFNTSFIEPVFDHLSGEHLFDREIDTKIYMPFYGRLDIVPFLDRVYDLKSLPPKDNRHKNALDDIQSHLYFGDIEEDWFYEDERFHLQRGEGDESILKFICEMLHPAVRDEHSAWREYLKKFNEILKPDGYQLISVGQVSGRDVFKAHEIDCVVVTHSIDTIHANMKLIGYGAYAQVFKYKDEFYQKQFALKRANKGLDDKELERFRREFEEMHSLHSPYIVEVYSYNEEKNEYTMELMDCFLQSYIIKNNDKLTVRERRSIINQVLRAIRYLHSKQIFHRDISIKNVLLKQYDDVLVVKLSDFGLVKIADSDLTSTNTEFKGSLNDPSLRIEGFKNYGLLHEIYALTLLCAFVLTGKQRWDRITDPTIKAFVEKGTNPVKEKRFQSLDELSQAVKKCYEVL